MDIKDAYHPTGNAKADGFKARTDALVDYLGREAAASGGVAQSMASTAAMRLNEAAYWAARAFTAEDFVVGDDGGGKGPDRSKLDPSVSPNDEGLDGIDHHGDSDP